MKLANSQNNGETQNPDDYYRLKQEKTNQQLKIAYRSLSPNDIYRQYYSSKSK
jgi:hypothetical protein